MLRILDRYDRWKGLADMIYVNVILTVKNDGDVSLVQELLTEHARLSKEEPGCARFEVYHSTNDQRVFILNEHWENQGALDIHRTALGYTSIYQPQVVPLVDRTPHPSELIAG